MLPGNWHYRDTISPCTCTLLRSQTILPLSYSNLQHCPDPHSSLIILHSILFRELKASKENFHKLLSSHFPILSHVCPPSLSYHPSITMDQLSILLFKTNTPTFVPDLISSYSKTLPLRFSLLLHIIKFSFSAPSFSEHTNMLLAIP